MAQGGKFKHGFICLHSRFGDAGPQAGRVQYTFGQLIIAAVVGCMAAELGGGKFANGTVTGAFVMMFNEQMHEARVKKYSAWFGSNFIGPGPDNIDPDNIKDERGKKLEPIDEVDQAAKNHDKAYFQAHANGISGAMGNLDVTGADRKLVLACSKTIMKYELRMTDNITHQKVSYATYARAWAVIGAFGPISSYKTINITVSYLNPYR